MEEGEGMSRMGRVKGGQESKGSRGDEAMLVFVPGKGGGPGGRGEGGERGKESKGTSGAGSILVRKGPGTGTGGWRGGGTN